MKYRFYKNGGLRVVLLGIVMLMMLCSTARATTVIDTLDTFDGWNVFATDSHDDAHGGDGYEADYLFYKLDGQELSLGLQTRFNVEGTEMEFDNHLHDSGDHTHIAGYYGGYFAGGLALSFDGDVSGSGGSGYEYAVDFGLYTEAYGGYYRKQVSVSQDAHGDHGHDTGTDAEGLYGGVSWRNDLIYDSSAPFAMTDSDTPDGIVGALMSNDTGTEEKNGFLSYYRKVVLNLANVSGVSSENDVDVHWTMSCGNDEIDGHIIGGNPVPEPTTIALLGIGLAGFGGSYLRRRRRQKKAA